MQSPTNAGNSCAASTRGRRSLPPDWLKIAKAAKLAGYTLAHFRQLTKAETVEAQKRDRDWFLKKASVRKWADRVKHLGTAKHDPTSKRKTDPLLHQSFCSSLHLTSHMRAFTPLSSLPQLVSDNYNCGSGDNWLFPLGGSGSATPRIGTTNAYSVCAS